MLLRANALAKGYSGARPVTVELLVECLNRGVLPHVPSRGSVGASGDLAPLAHLALPLIGEGEATFDGRAAARRRGARAGRPRAGPAAGEGGALARERHAVHGRVRRARARSAPTRLREDSRHRVRALARGAAGLAHELPAADPRAAAAAGPGRRRPANVLRLLEDSAINEAHRWCDQVQDAYSLRCAPQVHGASRDLLDYVRADRRRRAERGHRQPARARRGRACSSRTGTSTGSRSRSRWTRWRWRSPSSRTSPSGASSGSSTRTSPAACRRS